MTAAIQSSSTVSTAVHNGLNAFTFSENGIASGVDSGGIRSIGASVAANALTATLAPTTINFRSTTLSSGATTQIQTTSTLSLTVPSGATLGTINGVQSDLYLIAINNAGTVELAIVNSAGGNDLSGMGLISTTAISASSNAANVIYSASARTNVAYRVVGLIRSTQATAGTWASAPSLVQGKGGSALTAMMSLGFGQTWQNVTGSRAYGTTYYNTTGKPIFVSNISSAVATYNITISGSAITNAQYGNCSFIVPAGASYLVTATTGVVQTWSELR